MLVDRLFDVPGVLMKALLCTDGSPGALEAAHLALPLLGDDVELDVVTVIPELEDPLATAGGFEGSLITEEEAEERHSADEAQGRSALESTRRAIGASVETEMVESDDPGRTICELAAQRAVDLVVIGGSDKGWFSRLIHGSVMEYVVHHSPCPVLVVRHQPGE